MIRTSGGRFVDGINQVDAWVFLQAVLHRGLTLGLVTKAVSHTYYFGGLGQFVVLGIKALQTITLQETIVALCANWMAGEQIESCDLGGFASQSSLGILTNQHTSLIVIGGKQSIGGILWVSGAVQRNHHHASITRLLNGGHNGLRVAGGDQNGLRTCGNHIFERGHLTSVIAIGLACTCQQFRTLISRHLGGTFAHLHKKWVGFGLGDQPNNG